MTTFYVVPDKSGYGDWAIKTDRGKKSNAQTQSTGKSSARRYAEPGDTVVVYGNRKKQIVEKFEVK